MPPNSSFERRLQNRLSALERDGLLRSLQAPEGIDLSSNDYLCLATHPLVKQRMAEAVLREGAGSTGSRLLRGERETFAQIERRFAAWKRAERALYFSSGYLANLAVMTAFADDPADVIYSDERNHASLIDGIRLCRARRVIFPHNDVAALADLMAGEGASGQKFVVTESLFSMDGGVAPLAEYAELCRFFGAVLIVDEAHAVGVYGERGSGLIEQTGVEAFVSVNTAGKALGVCGAFVTGSGPAIEYLIQRARTFIFSTAPPPAIAAALDASLTLVETERWRRTQLLARAAYLQRKLGAAGLLSPARACTQIIPIILGDNNRAVRTAELLQREGFDARAIRPPSVAPGTARLRISLNTNLSESTLDRFVAALESIVKESGACSAVSS